MSRGPAPRSPEEFRPLLLAAGNVAALSLPDFSLEPLSRYLAELDLWRRTTNLTGDLSAEELAGHVLETAAGRHLIADGADVIDIGSGAGLPGIPLAVVKPGARFTLLEPRSRRAAFLRHAIRTIPLANASVLEARAEDLPPGAWTAATTRALGDLGTLLRRAEFLQPGGTLLAWTTDANALAGELRETFALRTVERLPERGVIGLFEKR